MGKLLKDNFSSFDRLSESQKGIVAKNWDRNMRMKYLNRHSSMTEEEFFKELDKIVDGTFDDQIENIRINRSKGFIENCNVRTILNEDIQRTRYMDLEEARLLLHAKIDKLEESSK